MLVRSSWRVSSFSSCAAFFSSFLAMHLLGSTHVGLAQSVGPAARLQAAAPETFLPGHVVDGAELGLMGARIEKLTPALEALGFRTGDFVYAVDAIPLAREAAPRGPATDAVFTVYRRVTEQRPVVKDAILARRVLDQFEDLPAAERTSMRLARMLANQKTLMDHGAGVLLLPHSASGDDHKWLRVANPMPPPSEAAVEILRQAVEERVPALDGRDGFEQAQASFAEGDYLEALERLRRALLQIAATPDRRGAEPLTHLVDLYERSKMEQARREAEFLAPAPFWGIVAEASLNHIQSFLPQNTLLLTENSTGQQYNVGMRLRLFDKTDLLTTYGYSSNSFENQSGAPQIDTRLHSVNFEINFRPLVLSRLTPMLRGGVGIFFLDADVYSANGQVVEQPTDTGVGGIFGAGVDAFYWQQAKLRGTIGGTFRILNFSLNPAAYPGWVSQLPPGNTVQLEDGLYKLDMDGWQIGLFLSRNF